MDFSEISQNPLFKFNDKEASIYAEKADNFQIIQRQEVDLDEEFYAVIEDAEDNPEIVPYATTHKIEKARHYLIRRKKDNKVMVQFSLHGIFAYNGKKSLCTDTFLNVYNHAPKKFQILNRTNAKSGIWATARCAVRRINNGKVYRKLLRIGVKPDELHFCHKKLL